MKHSQKNIDKIKRHSGYKIMYSFIIIIMISSYIVTLNGYATTEPQVIKIHETVNIKSYEIISVTLKNDSVIDLKNTSARYVKEYKDEKNVIVYTSVDTLQISKDRIVISSKTEIIKISEIQKVTIKKNSNFQISLFYKPKRR